MSRKREPSQYFDGSLNSEIDPKPSNSSVRRRIHREIEHGRFLAEHGAGEIWNWESPAGKLRWTRRVKMLSNHLEPGMRVLELGCGTGYFTRELARSGADDYRDRRITRAPGNRESELFCVKCSL